MTRTGKVSTGSVAGGTTASPVRTSKQPSCQAQTSTPSRGSKPASREREVLVRAVVLDREELAGVADEDDRRAVDLDRDQLAVAQLVGAQDARVAGRGRVDHVAGVRRERQQPRLGHVLDAPAQPLASEAGVLDAAVGHRVGAPGRDVVDDDAADLELVVGAEQRPVERRR